MILKYVSVKQVMARVVDDVGGKLPGHYFDAMLEWIPQAIRLLETKYQLVEKSTGNCERDEDGNLDPKALVTVNHVVPIPNDVISIVAVENEFGERVRYASSEVDFTNQTDRYSTGGGFADDARPTNFQVDVFDHMGVNPANGEQSVPYNGSDLVQVTNGFFTATYKVQGNMIQTSEECMFIKLHYLSLNTDQEGYLMIPDVEEYKQALGFYVLRQLIGAGFKHPVWNGPQGWQFFDNQWEKYATRALGVIKYPDQDKMEKLRTGFAERLIPPRYAYDDFFTGIEQIQEIQGI